MKNVKVNGKWDIVLPDHRADRPEWHTPPYWEEKRINHLHDHLTKDDVLYYIGAEEGDIAGLCAMWVKDIVLFEPNDRVWPNIKAIWEYNYIKHPFCFDGFASFISSQPLGLYLNFPPCANGQIITDHGFKELRDPGNIKQIRIDDVITLVDVPTAISLDVEGSEGRVLRGAEEVLRRYHPKIWLSLHPEFLHEQYGEWGGELRRWIMDLGYKETLIDYPLHEVHLYYEH